MYSFSVKDFVPKETNVVVYFIRNNNMYYGGLIEKETFEFVINAERNANAYDNGVCIGYRSRFSFVLVQARLDDAIGVANIEDLSQGKWIVRFVSVDKRIDFSTPFAVGLNVEVRLSQGAHNTVISSEFISDNIDFIYGSSIPPIQIINPTDGEVVTTLTPEYVARVRGDVLVRFRLINNNDNSLVETWDAQSVTGVLVKRNVYELRYTSNTPLAEGTSYTLEYAIVIGSTEISLTRITFKTKLNVPSFTLPLNHYYIYPLTITLNSVTNAIFYELRIRAVGTSSWINFPSQTSRDFTILPTLLDNSQIILNGIEIQSRCSNALITSDWSSSENTVILEPDFNIEFVPALNGTPVVEFGFPEKVLNIQNTRTPPNSEPLSLFYIPKPQTDTALDFTHTDAVGSSETAGSNSQVRLRFAAGLQQPASNVYTNQIARVQSKHGTVVRDLTFSVEVKDRFYEFATHPSCLIAFDLFQKRKRGTLPHIGVADNKINIIRSFGSLNLDLSNPTIEYQPNFVFDFSTNQTKTSHNIVNNNTRQNLHAAVSYSGTVTIVGAVNIELTNNVALLGGNSWFVECYSGVPNFGNTATLSNQRKNQAAFPYLPGEYFAFSLVASNIPTSTHFAIGGAQVNTTNGSVERYGNGYVQFFALFVFAGDLATTNPTLRDAIERYCMDLLNIP